MASEPGEEDFDHSEIEVPTVVGLIRNILTQYPDSGQILKELIQNAEDARATKVEVVYTAQGCCTEGVSNIIKPFLSGGGICVYNDEVFGDADWQGIKRLSESIKRSDPTTVGRFGLGFKSVFHITDFVTILSGNKVLFMNPCEPESRMCRVIHLSKLHQHLPSDICIKLWGRFINENHIQNGNFDGTIFWFPLRIAPSKLSDNVYTHKQVVQLFDSFATEGSMILIFLRSLEKVSLQMIKYPHEESPVPYMVVELQSSTMPTIRTKRQEFCSQLDTYIRDETHDKIMCYYNITISTLLNGEERKSHYSILHYVSPKGQTSSHIGQLEDSQLPLVGIAAPLDKKSKAGQLFCFLPLPMDQENHTNLPVFVNGYFVLSQNRRHVLWKSAEIIYDKDVEWNEFLMDQVLPMAYFELIKNLYSELTKGILNVNVFYQVIPSVCTAHGKWQILARKIWNALKTSSIIYSDVKKELLPIDQVIVTNPLNSDEEVNKSVLSTLIELNTSLATLPDSIWESLCYLNWKVATVNPSLLLIKLRVVSSSLLSNWNRRHLLEYILSDEESHNQLDGLPLLPLANGCWSQFSPEGEKIYLCSKDHAQALVGIEHKILDRTLTENLHMFFEILSQKGTTQIEKLDVQLHGPSLVEASIAAQHTLNPNSVSLHKWLSCVWTMLLNIPLKTVQHLTLIPTKPNPKMTDLIALNSAFIGTTDDSYMSDNVCYSLKHLGVNVIRIENYIKHSDFHYFMCDSTGNGIVKAICKALKSSNIENLAKNFNENTSELHSSLFIDSLPIENTPNDVQKLLSYLEVFKATDIAGRDFLTSIRKHSQVYPQICDFPLTYHETTIHARNDREIGFMKHLGASLLTLESICLSSLKVTHTHQNLQKLVIYIMNNYHLKNNHSIQQQLKSTKFVPNQHGTLCQPSDLYDPVGEYAVILESDMLPCHTFHKCLSFLRIIGLKQVLDISSQRITKIVTSFSKMDIQESFNKASVVLKLINIHREKNLICDMIRSVPCIPGSVNKAPNYPDNLHWNTSRRLYCPEEVKSFETFGMTLGSIMTMANPVHIQGIADYFQWGMKPSATMFVNHLKNIVNSFSSTDALYIDIIRKCYLELNSFAETVTEANALKELVDLPCILTKHGLKRPSEVYIEESNDDLDLRPYFSSPLFKSQEEVTLFRYLGCSEDQSMELYLNLLKKIHDNFPSHITNDSKCREGDLKLIINILERLENNVKVEDLKRIYIPVETSGGNFELVLLEHCCYADHNLNWLNFDKENNPEIRLIHNKVDINLAKSLGVPPLQKQLVSCGMPFEEWGQSQPLTSRLRDLLDQYRDGVSVLKELVQNADDAGAQTVCFLYDERENEEFRTGCLTTKLGEVQGPALWAYNDKEFSQNDLENIKKLGGRTKEEQSTKIGKFGLGFCSVYNLTDVPSFMSGSNYVLFDPHMTFIERNEPGIKYDFSMDNNRKIINWFGSQFKPFEDVFEYKNGCNFNGTLFRLPLRTPSQATTSEISNVAYGSDQIIQLLKMFMEMAGNLMLFTQNVKEIKIYHLNKQSSPKESKLMFHTKREIDRSLTIDINTLQDVSTTSTQIQRVSELVTCYSSPFNEIMFLNISVDIKSIGKSLCNLEEGCSDTSWIISWHSGGSELVEQAKNLNTLPLGAIALPLDKQSDGWMPKCMEDLPTGFYKKSHLHCFLPLPIETCFPVHINGYFEVASDRRSIKLLSSDDRSGIRDWNLELISHSIVPAYHNLLIALKLDGLSPEYRYYSLWPLQENCFDILQRELVKKFYEEISEKDIQCFCDNGEWYSLSQCSFLEESFYSQNNVGKLAFEFLDHHLETDNRKMVELPKDFADELGSEVVDNLINAEVFYLDYFIPNINEKYICEDERDDLVVFSLETGSEAVLSELKETECISAQPFGKLQKPRSLIDPGGKVAFLYSLSDERFPIMKHLKSSHNKDVLKRLGMMQAIIPGEMLLERANSVQNIMCAQCAIERCKNLISYIYFNNKSHENEISQLKNILFLPVESKPPDWECTWAGDAVAGSVSTPCSQHHEDDSLREIKFAKPSSLFTSRLKNLVGSTELVLNDTIQSTLGLDLLGVKHDSRTIQYKSVIQQLHCVSAEVHDYSSNWLSNICREIYSYFNTNLQRNNPNFQLLCEKKVDYGEFCSDIKALKTEKVLLTKVGFYCAKVFTIRSNIDCSPDLFSTHSENLRGFPNLISELDIKYNFGPVAIIDAIKLKGENFIEVCLTDDDINQYSKLLNILSQELNDTKKISQEPNETKKSYQDIIKNLDLKNICLPCKSGHLKPVDDLCIDDGLNTKTKRFSFVHPNLGLSFELSEALGIKTITRKILLESSDRIPFGQSEKLTTRLRNILEDYTCDEGIMKELLQNADDAGATEIAFIMDTRNLPTESLFDEGYAPLQGPALCVFNNGCFTAEDIKGIAKLGDSVKKIDPESTGQYGIGFNAVYHITDAPSFLTRGENVPHGEVLCMFDPLCKYDPESSLLNPGVQYYNLEKLRELHSDSFKGYLEDDVMKGNGTLFRLPLRTDQYSEISKKVNNIADIELMLEMFKIHMHESLLFLKNVKKISIQKIHTNGKRIEEFSVESSLESTGKSSLKQYKEYLKNQVRLSKCEEPIPLCNIKQLAVEYQMQIKDSEGNSFRWHVAQQLGSNEPDKVPKIILNAFCNKELRLLPHAGVAILLDANSELDVSHVISCYLPLPAISGLPFSINGHFALNSSRRDLWTGEDTVRGMWNTWLIKNVLTPAAARAIEYFRVEIFSQDTVLLSLDDYRTMMNPYYNLLPSKSDVMSPNWKQFVKDLYQYIKDESLKFFDVFILEEEKKTSKKKEVRVSSIKPMNIINKIGNSEDKSKTEIRKGQLHWHALSGDGDQFPIHFLGNNFNVHCQNPLSFAYSASDVQNIRKVKELAVENTLKKIGMKISSNAMFEKLSDVEMNLILVTPDTVFNFLSSWKSENPESCNIHIDTEVEHSPFQSINLYSLIIEFLSGSEDFVEKINGLPLLVTEDNIIREFSGESPVFLSDFHGLLPASSKEFVNRFVIYIFQKAFSKYRKTKIAEKMTSQNICHSVKQFRIPDFAQRIHLELTSAYCTEDDKKLALPKNSKEQWLNRVWKFIASDIPKDDNLDIEWKKGKSYILKHLGKWALYPIIYKKEKYVIPIMHANRVLNLETERESSPFRKLPLPIPDMSIEMIKGTTLETFLSDPNSVLNILDIYNNEIYNTLETKTLSQKKNLEKKLNKEDCLKILKYFGKNIKLNLSKIQLKHLPFYIDLENGLTCIDERKTIVLPFTSEAVPIGIREMAEALSYVILTHGNEDLQELYKYLDFSFHDHILDVYSTFILPNFDHLPEEFHNQHLEYLKKHLQFLYIGYKKDWGSRECQVVNQLQVTSFIKYENVFCKASDFYSPFNVVFNVMKMSNLPEEWCKTEWEKFLILAGIINEVKPDIFLKMAKKLSLEKDDVKKKSEILISHLFKNTTEFKQIFSELRDIEFIVPEIRKTLEEILPHYGTASGLISFNGSLPSKFSEIAWTVATILPSYADINSTLYGPLYMGSVEKKKICQSWGILSKPVPRIVSSHIRNITNFANNLAIDKSKRTAIEKIMDRIYYILKICEVDVVQNLLEEEVPLVYIPDHQTCITPTNVIISLEEEIVPYMYSFPLRYGSYLSLFNESFSVKQKPSCENYAKVLSMIYNIAQNEKLSPEEQRCIKLAMKGLVSDERLIEKMSVTELYLPSRSGIMVNSSNLYVADNKGLEKYIKDSFNLPMFLGFEKLGILMDDAHFIRLLPECVRPKFLNDVLVEVFDNEIKSEISGPLSKKIQNFLLTPEFIHAVLRISNHVKGKGLFKEDKEIILQRIEAVEVIQLKSINISLFFKDEKIGSKSRPYFVQKSEENEIIHLYLEKNCSKADAKDGLTEVYRDLLNISDLETVGILRSVFDHMKTPSILERYLDRKSLKSYGNESLDFYIPSVGSYLDVELVDLLDNGFYSFHDEEIAVMEKYIQEENDLSRQDDTFIIVQIKRLVKVNNGIMHSEYEVDIGEDVTIVVNASQLFKFVRSKNLNESSGIVESANLETENHASQLDLESFDDSGFECFVSSGSSNSSYQPDPEESLSVQEIMKKIKSQLIEIWKNTDLTQRRQLVRRLQLQWHPDKNSRYKEELCTRCFQYIQSLIARLERGEPIPDEEDYNSVPKESPSDEYSNFFRRSHYDFRNDNHQHNYSSRSRKKNRKMPDRLEAQLWMKQAEHDFQSAKDELSQSGSSCWISYKCYEATKNALISALYLVDREKGKAYRNRADLTTIASALNCDGHNHALLMTAVSDMEDRVNLCGNLRQPTHIHLPCDSYQVNDAKVMISKAEIVVDAVNNRHNE